MSVKQDLRRYYKEKRHLFLHKADADAQILKQLFAFSVYQNAEVLLCYASLPDEIQTDAIIKCALQSGKNVFLPVCSDSEGHMDFYEIKSLQYLKHGFFGVREPDLTVCTSKFDFSSEKNTLCIVPGLSFDLQGFRLGYGKGYYDRFLSRFTGASVGLCYADFINPELPADVHDCHVDFVITETECINCKE